MARMWGVEKEWSSTTRDELAGREDSVTTGPRNTSCQVCSVSADRQKTRDECSPPPPPVFCAEQ